MPQLPRMLTTDWGRGFVTSTMGRDDEYGDAYPYHVRTFFLDEAINNRRWAVTNESMKKFAATFVGKPAVMIPSLEHPSYAIQDAYKVGSIRTVDYNEKKRSCSGIVSLTADAAGLVSSGAVKYTSVQLAATRNGTQHLNVGTPFAYDVCHEWYGEHIALVGSPAYGKDKAVIKRICQGNLSKCTTELPKSASAGKSPSANIAPYLERSLRRMYSPCTLTKTAVTSPRSASFILKHPNLTAAESLALAISSSPTFRDKVDSIITTEFTDLLPE